MICRAMPYNPLLPNIKYLWKRLQCLCITNICGEMEAGHKYLTAATSHSVWHYKAAHDCLFGNAFRIKLINNGRSSLNTMSISTDVSSLPWSIYLPIDTETDWRANILSVRHLRQVVICGQQRVAPKCIQLQAILCTWSSHTADFSLLSPLKPWYFKWAKIKRGEDMRFSFDWDGHCVIMEMSCGLRACSVTYEEEWRSGRCQLAAARRKSSLVPGPSPEPPESRLSLDSSNLLERDNQAYKPHSNLIFHNFTSSMFSRGTGVGMI